MFFTSLSLFFKSFLYLEGKGGRKRGRKTPMCGCLSRAPTGDLACHPAMCPDWELNQRPLASRASIQSTEPHQPGQEFLIVHLRRYILVPNI